MAIMAVNYAMTIVAMVPDVPDVPDANLLFGFSHVRFQD